MSGAFIGLDLGGTKVAAAALQGGELGDPLLRPTELSSTEVLIDQLAELVDEARPGEVEAVGIGVPSVVEFRTGRVVSSVDVQLADVPLRQVLGGRLGVPVFVDNDASVAALAEAYAENLELVARNLVMLTVGTGVGGGVVLGGRIYRGSTGGAGEFGHTIVGLHLEGQDRVPTGDAFPQPGSLEAVASGQAMDRFAVETAKLSPDSALGRIKAQGTAPTGVEAVEAAKAGDDAARRTVEAWGERVGIGVANAINTFDPDEVVIGGGAVNAGDLLLGPASRVAQAYIHPGLAGHARIRLARHGVRAGVLGAALLALDEVERGPGEEWRMVTEPTSREVS